MHLEILIAVVGLPSTAVGFGKDLEILIAIVGTPSVAVGFSMHLEILLADERGFGTTVSWLSQSTV